MNYDEIVRLLRHFRDQRGWQKYHNLKDLAISLNLEASEVLEIFQWQPADQPLNAQQTEHLSDELADTMIYLTYMFDKLGIDPGDAIKKKMHFNQHRHWPKIDQQKTPKETK
ncbi:nucleotide pyrophosphohydrolase [Limosilactobacillus difficilis]|uniref:nucleotide pyrophosphohydrolase n=1 Tax=Limosilactobacillus difficilis TaxID=2991838 RepID=UPI0024B9D9F8|nr:nucleotide pyrophosphohydrolase [Limosilactobacillus difficilis]